MTHITITNYGGIRRQNIRDTASARFTAALLRIGQASGRLPLGANGLQCRASCQRIAVGYFRICTAGGREFRIQEATSVCTGAKLALERRGVQPPRRRNALELERRKWECAEALPHTGSDWARQKARLSPAARCCCAYFRLLPNVRIVFEPRLNRPFSGHSFSPCPLSFRLDVSSPLLLIPPCTYIGALLH